MRGFNPRGWRKRERWGVWVLFSESERAKRGVEVRVPFIKRERWEGSSKIERG